MLVYKPTYSLWAAGLANSPGIDRPGFRRPLNDNSNGCSVSDTDNVPAVTASDVKHFCPFDHEWFEALCPTFTNPIPIHDFSMAPARRWSRSINALHNMLLHGAEGADFGDAVPGVRRARFATDGFVALEEARHEKLLCQRGQLHAAPGAIIYQFHGLAGIHDAQDRARLGRVVSNGEFVFRPQRHAGGKTHQRVAVSGIKTDAAFEHFLDDEADILRGHGGAAAEHAADARVVEIDFLGERFEEFRRGEEAADPAVLQNRHRLVHHVFHVSFGLVGLFVADDLLHPARVEIDEVTGAAAEIGEVLDGQTQAARAGRTDHQPRSAPGKVFVGDFSGEFLVVHLVIVPADALLGHAGGAAGLKNVERSSLGFRWHPDFGLKVAQPFILKVREFHQVGEGLDFLARIEVLLRPIEPERAAGLRRKMPLDYFAQVGIESLLRGFDGGGVNGHR